MERRGKLDTRYRVARVFSNRIARSGVPVVSSDEHYANRASYIIRGLSGAASRARGRARAPGTVLSRFFHRVTSADSPGIQTIAEPEPTTKVAKLDFQVVTFGYLFPIGRRR